MISEGIFRAYDIRGVYGKEITDEIAKRIGNALAVYVGGEGKTMLVGRDVRKSGESLCSAVSDGMLAGGLNVEDIGVVTTPLLYFCSVHYGKDGGVMVTASHNPSDWNGFKIWAGNSFISMGMGMEKLKNLVLEGKFRSASRGSMKRNLTAISDYIDYVSGKIEIQRKLKIIADPGNGSCCVLIPEIFDKTGLNVTAINAEPDGSFPSHSPEPSEETLVDVKSLVLRQKADFGVGYDADGDRAVFVDDKGRMVSSTVIFIMLADHYLKKNPGAAVVYEVSCSLAVEETIRANGGKPILSQVGHTYIVDKILKEKAVFGGETSGHFYFMDVYGFDDAIFTSLKVAEVLSKKGIKLSDIADSTPEYPRIPIKNYVCSEEKKFLVVKRLAKEFIEAGFETVTLDGVKVIEDEGWFLIRPSNTQPLVRLTVEAKTQDALQRLVGFAENKINKAIKETK
ncbi:phosphomannomutase/phosphoglucomutase [Candidatus Bathyarchaeota archaeon]|nr:phosphomannomutase/phosphoglucomutase [Candidatus Bathyarchaeota archaeon]